jgi:hypothetical protein
MILEIEHYDNPERKLCSHTECDGRPAQWTFPQAIALGIEKPFSCSVHLARISEKMLAALGAPVAINRSRRNRVR